MEREFEIYIVLKVKVSKKYVVLGSLNVHRLAAASIKLKYN